MQHDIHFWLGSECSLDESGSAALFSAQLDEALGGGPVQYREVQGKESPEFRQLFPRIHYQSGGVESGFNQTDNIQSGIRRLYQIKSQTRKGVQVYEVPLTLESLNSGDSFLLEDENEGKLFVWHGSGANIREKMRALEVSNSFKSGTDRKVVVMDESEKSSTEAQEFFGHLGVAEPAQVVIPPAEAPEAEPESLVDVPRLFEVRGEHTFHEVASGVLKRGQLKHDQQLVLLAGSCVWVWCGRETVHANAMQVGQRFQSWYKLPAHAVIKTVRDRFEPAIFGSYFEDWNEHNYLLSFGSVKSTNSSASPLSPANSLDQMAADMVLPKSVAGAGPAKAAYNMGEPVSLEVWVAKGVKLQEVSKEERGDFYDAESYVVLYKYKKMDGSLAATVYYWVGRHSSPAEQGTAAMTSQNMRAQHPGAPLVRVAQNHEPHHFTALFSGALIVHWGARPDSPSTRPTEPHLYQVKADSQPSTHAVEVRAEASSLNSGDCYVLVEPRSGGVVLWQGQYGSPEERSTAAQVAARLAAKYSCQMSTINEGSEGSGFWSTLGGEASYPRLDARKIRDVAPVLFHVRDAGVRGVAVERFDSYCQDDLFEDDVMMLDVGSEVYIWFGANCSASERHAARELAQRYLKELSEKRSDRGSNTPIVEVESGQEPPFFTCHFPGWDPKPLATYADVYAEKLKNLQVA